MEAAPITEAQAYPQDVLWQESPHGYWYNGGNPQRVRALQEYMRERGFTPPVVLCHERDGNVYYTPQDPTWTDTLIGASMETGAPNAGDH